MEKCSFFSVFFLGTARFNTILGHFQICDFFQVRGRNVAGSAGGACIPRRRPFFPTTDESANAVAPNIEVFGLFSEAGKGGVSELYIVI